MTPTPPSPAAISSAETILDAKSEPLVLSDAQVIPNAVMFQVAGDGLALVEQHQLLFRSLGATFFIAAHGHGVRKDLLGLAGTTDPFELVRLVGTDAPNYRHDTEAVIGWLRELNQLAPFRLTGAGCDFVEGTFLTDVRDPRALAARIHSFCPDFVNQGLALVEEGPAEDLIVEHFSTDRSFFFWWD